MANDYGAFVPADVKVESSGAGRLAGKTYAVKDVFAIQGHVSGAGNPDWLRTHGPSDFTADAVRALAGEGAVLAGVTHTDELMFSLNGENVHYGTPVNPKAEGRIPGGSSSGSAVAVAAGLADLALGTDTGGSVRIPASYCGVYGFRPTHGAVSMNGVIPLAPSFDTVGWFAADPDLLRLAGEILLPDAWAGKRSGPGGAFNRVYFPEEAWALADPRYEGLPESWIPGLEESGTRCEWTRMTENGLKEWMSVFRAIQGFEIWQTHGAWIEEAKPAFAPDIGERFAWAKSQGGQSVEAEWEHRKRLTLEMERLLGDRGLLLIPTAPGEAPPIGMEERDLADWRLRVMQLTCIAGLTGLPQLQIPLESGRGAPIGLSLIAGRGRDLDLLRWACELIGSKRIELLAHAR